jgi:ABC-type uncharacterized transport system auxiliary subunit
MTMTASKNALAVVVCAAMSGGCAGSILTSDAEPAATYQLHHAPSVQAPSVTTGAAVPPTAARLPLVLAVARPRASSTLDTDRIATLPGGSRFDYYADARWAETAPQMLQHTLVDALTADGRFDAVVAAPARVPHELLLALELRRFESVTTSAGGAPVVHVQLMASLVDSRRSVRLVSFVSEASAQASENRLSAVISAFEAAHAAVIDDVVRRVHSAAGAATTPAPPPSVAPRTP